MDCLCYSPHIILRVNIADGTVPSYSPSRHRDPVIPGGICATYSTQHFPSLLPTKLCPSLTSPWALLRLGHFSRLQEVRANPISRRYIRFPYHPPWLTPSRRQVAWETIPADIVRRVCEGLEPALFEGTQSGESIASRKYSKNRDIRAVSHVCRSWNSHATAFVCLWRDIAFNAEDPASVRLAADFLSLVKNQDVPLNIYAAFGPETTSLDPRIVELLIGLRRHVHRWALFEYQGSLCRYRSQLDLPAPSLRYFSDHRDASPSQDITPLFSGYTPSLRHLLTASIANWESVVTLNYLTEFHFERSGPGPAVSLDLLLSFFRRAPELETLRLGWLDAFILDCAPDSNVSLPRLHTLYAHNTDFYTLVEHMEIPNIYETTHEIDAFTHPTFKAPHALFSLPPVPILFQPVCDLVVVLGYTAEIDFRIRLTGPMGNFFDIHLTWKTDPTRYWKNFIHETLLALTKRIRLDPKAILRLYLGLEPALPLSLGSLKVQGGFARRFLRGVLSPTSQLVSLPLVLHLSIAKGAEILGKDETQMLRLCLQSHETCEANLFLRLRYGSTPWHTMLDLPCVGQCKCDPQISPS